MGSNNGSDVARCCTECFADVGLRDGIIPSITDRSGNCSFCRSRDVKLVAPSSLFTWFEMLLSIYEINENGKTLVDLMQEDWRVFNGELLNSSDIRFLISEILDDGETVRKKYKPNEKFSETNESQWDVLRYEIMHKNRWFFDGSLESSGLHAWFDQLITKKSLTRTWYRSRINLGDSSFSIEDMAEPPRHLAGNGRANPAGIPYLYLGSTEEAAISEVRPHTGQAACVARFVVQEIHAVDLRAPRADISPFLLSDSEQIGRLRKDIPLLERLGAELNRPVVPQRAAYEYTPAQYLCEFIKSRGYDGVVYASSVSDGINLALFDPSKAVGIDTKMYDINQVSLDIERRE